MISMELPKHLNQIPILLDAFAEKFQASIPHDESSDTIKEEESSIKDEQQAERLIQLEADFISLTEDFFCHLNLSVLYGEYSSITDNYKFKNKLISKTTSFIDKIKDLSSVYFEDVYHDARWVCEVIQNAVDKYVELVIRFSRKISNDQQTHLSINFVDNDDDREYIHFDEMGETLYLILHHNSTLYELNISASIADFSLEYIDFERVIRKLQKGIVWIDNISNTRIALSDAVKEKCGFLSFKIMSRIKVEDPDTTLVIDSNPYSIDVVQTFEEWSNHIFRHYEINDPEKARTEIKAIKDSFNASYSNLKLSEIHLLIKFYKDCSAYLHSEVFDQLADAVKKRYDDLVKAGNKNKFDEFSHKLAINYVLNNQLSDIIQKSNGEDSAIQALYSKICKTQEETNVDNFFPHSKYLDYLLDKIASLIKEKNIFETIGQIEPLLKRARRVFDRYNKNVYWSQKKYNYIFYLSFEECFVSYSDKDFGEIKIFIASSFTLPLRKEKYIQEFEENKKRLVNIERSIEVLQIVATEHNELKDKSERLAKEVKTKEIKYIEILSIFAAIIVFAAGSFTTLLNVARGVQFGELRGIIISIGLILVLFVAVVFFISQVPFSKLWEQVKKNDLQKWVLPLLVLVPLLGTIGSGIYYTGHHINQTYKEALVKQENIINKQDSVISMQSLNIAKRDSILAEQERLLNQLTDQTPSGLEK